ncbi:atp-binding cassette sub-family a, partial [Lynx pardinus]
IVPDVVLQYCDPFLVFVFFLCFTVTSLAFSFLISTFFNRTTLAIFIGGFLYFLTFFPYIFVTAMYQHLSLAEKLSFCLLSNIAVALGIEYICKMEMK